MILWKKGFISETSTTATEARSLRPRTAFGVDDPLPHGGIFTTVSCELRLAWLSLHHWPYFCCKVQLADRTCRAESLKRSSNLQIEAVEQKVWKVKVQVAAERKSLKGRGSSCRSKLQTCQRKQNQTITPHANGEPLQRRSSSYLHSFPVCNDSACCLVCKWRW